LIQVSQLVFEYPGHRALDGVSVQIAAGTVTALVGPNGAGKSTLMRCIAGLDQPLSGQVHVHGIPVQERPREVHRHLGYLSDFFGLYDRLSVQHCLQYAALSMGVAPDQAPQRVARVAEQLGLAALLERRPTELSRGQRQRVAIGQAIVHQPRVLLLDEPTAALDPEATARVEAELRSYLEGGAAILMVTHNPEQARRMGRRGWRMEQGKLEPQWT
jgi:ABC-2 type transport system ATP-binding protein